jgi:hypothetical protein
VNGKSVNSYVLTITTCGQPSLLDPPTLIDSTVSNIHISWNSPLLDGGCPILKYEILIEAVLSSNVFSSLIIIINDPNVIDYNITSFPFAVAAGNGFRFIIRAYNKSNSNQSQASIPFYLNDVPQTPATAPYPDLSLTNSQVLVINYNAVTVDNGSSIFTYELQMTDKPTFTDFQTISSNTLSLIITVTNNVVKGTTYYFRYRAVNSKGFSQWSPVGSALAASTPSIPPQPTYKTSSSNSITINVIPSNDNGGSPITNYYVYTDNGSLSAFNNTPICTGLITVCIANALNSGIMYRFYTVAENAIGKSANSLHLSVYASDSLPTPNAPTQVIQSNNINILYPNSIIINWTHEPATQIPINGYALYITGGTYSTITEIYNGRNQPSIISTTLHGLTPNIPYKLQLKSFNANVSSDYSPAATIYACYLPSKFSTPQTTAQSSTGITISWNEPLMNGGCSIQGYAVYRDDGNSGSITTEVNSANDPLVRNNPNLSSLNVTSFPVGGLGSKFRFIVTAFNAVGSSKSPVVTGVLSDLPSTPGDTVMLSSYDNINNSLIVSYANPVPNSGGAPILSYEVVVDRNNSGIFESLAGLSSNNLSTSVSVKNIVPGYSYILKYRVKNAVGWGNYSNVSQIIPATTPLPPAAPTFKLFNGDLVINILFSSNNGGSNILYHELWTDVATPGTLAIDNSYDGVSSTYTLTTAMGYVLGNIYQFETKAYNSVGGSNFSSVSLIGFGNLPDQPNTVGLVNAKATSIRVNWVTPASDLPITKFTLTVTDQNNMTQTYTTIKNTYRVFNLIQGNAYTFSVMASNINGDSLPSANISYYSCDVPSNFQSLTFLSADNLAKTINISWNPPTNNGGCNILGYRLYRNVGLNTTITTEITINNNDPYLIVTFIDLSTELLGTIYDIQLVARNVNGSVNSNIVRAALCGLPNKPIPAVLDQSATTTNNLQVILENVNGNGCLITYYEVSYKQLTDSSFNSFISYTTTVSISNSIVPYVTYTVKYRAYNFNGSSLYSDEAYFNAATTPSQPGVPTFSNISSSSLDITISPSSSDNGSTITNYEIYMDDGNNGSFNPLSGYDLNSDGLTYNINYAAYSMTAGNYYKFKIIATNSIGDSIFSNIGTSSTADKPAKASNPQKDALLSTKTSLMVEFSKTSDTQLPSGMIRNYYLYISSDNTSFNTISIGQNLSYSVPGLTTGNTYYVKINSENSTGLGDESDVVPMLVCSAPLGLASPTITSISSTSVTINWYSPTDDGGCPIKEYMLFMNDGVVMNNLSQIQTADFTNKPNLTTVNIIQFPANTIGSTLYIKLRVYNIDSQYVDSSLTSFIRADIPTDPTNSPYQDLNNLSLSYIMIKYDPPISDGGTTIIEYSLEKEVNGIYTVITSSMYANLYFKDTSVTKGQAYTYIYRYRNAIAWSNYSPIGSLTCAVLPTQPPAPKLDSSSTTSIKLTLSPSPDNGGSPILYYNLYMDNGDLTVPMTKINAYDGTSTSYTISSGLTPTTKYRFAYTAVSAMGESEQIFESRFAAARLPDKPNDASEGSDTDETHITVTWPVAADTEIPITGYSLEMRNYYDTNWSLIYNGYNYATILQYSTTAVVQHNEYVFRYRAYNFNGPSVYSNELNIVACRNPSGLNAPTYTTSTITSISIKWTPPTDDGGCNILYYEVYRDDGNGSNVYTQVQQADTINKPNLKELEVTTLPAALFGYSFRFALKVITEKTLVSGATYSPWSNFMLFAGVPGKPLLPPINNILSTTSTQLGVDYNGAIATNGSSLVSINLQIDDGNGGAFVEVVGETSDSLSTSIIITSGITHGTTYRLRYRGKNSVGFGPFSDIGYISTLP